MLLWSIIVLKMSHGTEQKIHSYCQWPSSEPYLLTPNVGYYLHSRFLSDGYFSILFSPNFVDFISGIPPPCDALTIPSPFCNPEQQHLPQPSQPCPPQSPPPMVSSHLITSGFLMHGELNKTKAATKQPKRSKNLNSRR